MVLVVLVPTVQHDGVGNIASVFIREPRDATDGISVQIGLVHLPTAMELCAGSDAC
nr:hypothetical protein [Streptomyces graminofaciens]